jgi:hypothetical protein
VSLGCYQPDIYGRPGQANHVLVTLAGGGSRRLYESFHDGRFVLPDRAGGALAVGADDRLPNQDEGRQGQRDRADHSPIPRDTVDARAHGLDVCPEHLTRP